MNRETIENKAREQAEIYMVEAPYQSGPLGSYRKGFIEGANWSINAVWHDASEEPEREDEPICVEYEDWGGDGSNYTICNDIWDYNSRLKRDGGYCTILRWAYVSDLLPERKEETK